MTESGDLFGDGRYRIVRKLGRGAFGVVYEANDTRLNRGVALKILTSPDASTQERFLREAQAIARLRHPNIITIWDVGLAADALYIAQELLRGESLAEAMNRSATQMPLRMAIEILIQIAGALGFAHANGIVHRDVKPANIFLVDSASAKLLDFGVAKFTDQSVMTIAGFVGTPSYASPEQLAGSKIVDGRADVFALGAVAFEMVSGHRAFSGQTAVETIGAILNGPVPNLRTAAPDCPEELNDLIGRCLARDPALRPPTMEAVVADLEKILVRLGEPQVRWAWPTVSGPASPTVTPPPTKDSLGTMIGPVLTVDLPGLPMSPSASSSPRLTGSMAPWVDHAVDRGLPAGTRVGKFTVHELVAHGQTGHLYKVFDPVRSRLVGLKVIQNPTSISVSRLLRASRIWLDLHHPNLQTILEVDPGDGISQALIATELIEGVDLARLTSQRRLDLLQTIEVTLQICEALDYIHSRGIVHREVKPHNIVLSQPDLHVTLLDSGLARSTEINDLSLTLTGVIIGDLRYMSPEQAVGRYDQRSDIYSLGAVLYEMALHEEFKAPSGHDITARLERADELPPKLRATLLTALQTDPDLRFPSVREFSDGLRSLVPEALPPLKLSQVVITLHGIRTYARWQRAFSEVASRAGLHCRLDRWNFGYFSLFRFIVPWSRQAKVGWFRQTYHDEFGDQATTPLSSERPSIVAHSFGTYILGNALMRYPYLRFNKVLLCGSILPASFPWDVLIDRGQVQAVRNEYGARDMWTRVAQTLVPGTGPSGLVGFSCVHERMEQEEFNYSHSEYFEKGHMEDNWIPFIKRRVHFITPRERPAIAPADVPPYALYMLYLAIAAIVYVVARWRL